MKSIVLSAVICATVVGHSVASTYAANDVTKGHVKELVNDQKSVEAFKQAIGFHERNVDVLWEQYGLAEARIRESRGNHAELDRDKDFFTGVYQEDINKGIRVDESKKAIEEIKAMYTEKHAQRDAYEKKEVTRLQAQLKAELNGEKKRFDKAKKKYAGLVNEETLPLLRKAEEHFAKAIDRANSFPSDTAIAAR
ncbi:hypothetical protein [Parapedobacter koreensis]|uniref:Uncharacterized protein n=1 Tax=Parapedobacter koreensis TaxID=332977 RepID=A0A1H7SSU4_9SPHI|nr:hypothetical protein [Parapedobacter koreensis]SEL74994.1 hypothetical protein SAMN05421740_109139 [Parapedobacter koreensis]